MSTFRAFVVDDKSGVYTPEFRDLTDADLPAEKVLVDVAYSTLNYKDGLAVTGKGKIARKFPMVCGIDLAGTVAASDDPAVKPGDKVVVNGWGLSETFWGGYSARQRVKPEFITRLPPAFDFKQAMAIGTAGYTAMLCVLALEDAGVTPGAGDVLVTGAVGGVGSVAVALLAKLGYRVVASTGRPAAADYLKMLGAAEIVARADLDKPARPLEKARWAGVVDSVGGKTLGMAIAQTHEEGAVAACGLAGGTDLPTTVMPFILRGVKLLGVNSVTCPAARRDRAWARLATDLDKAKLDAMTTVDPLSKIKSLAEEILRGETRGRVVIDVRR
ncbi:MAG: MDR family oxidoreductase [Rhodospirillaceae bacterium]|nr:MDR family oxidoreductase [Rhodospirillaceae bacterium]